MQIKKYVNYNDLYDHQKDTVQKFLDLPHTHTFFADLSEPGTGKTLVQIYMLQQLFVVPILIVCPKSIMEAVWVAQLSDYFPIRNIQVLQGGSVKIKKQLDNKKEIYIINYDSFWRVFDDITQVDWKYVILDESTKIKNIKSKRTKSLIALAIRQDQSKLIDGQNRYKAIMTGTVAPNNLLDMFSQFRFLSQSIFNIAGKNVAAEYYKYRFRYMYQPPWNSYGWLPQDGAYNEILIKIKEFSVQHEKRKCTDLPPLIKERRIYELMPEQQKMYDAVKNDCLYEIESEQYTVDFVMTQLMKLRQICSGFMFYEIEESTGKIRQIHKFKTGKIGILYEIIEELGDAQSLIFNHFQPTAAFLKDELGDKLIHLESNDAELGDKLNKFESGGAQFLLMNPKSYAHGLNLQYCSNIIRYELDWDLEADIQSRDRINRIGQKHNMTEYVIIYKGIEKYIADNLDRKRLMNIKLNINNLKEAL